MTAMFFTGGLNSGAVIIFDTYAQFYVGHRQEYWASMPDGLGKETFANLYSAAIVDHTQYQKMKQVFPEIVDAFEKILEDYT